MKIVLLITLLIANSVYASPQTKAAKAAAQKIAQLKGIGSKASYMLEEVYSNMRTGFSTGESMIVKGFDRWEATFINDQTTGLKISSLVKPTLVGGNNPKFRHFIHLDMSDVSVINREKIDKLIMANRRLLEDKRVYDFPRMEPSTIRRSITGWENNQPGHITIEIIDIKDSAHLTQVSQLVLKAQRLIQSEQVKMQKTFAPSKASI